MRKSLFSRSLAFFLAIVMLASTVVFVPALASEDEVVDAAVDTAVVDSVEDAVVSEDKESLMGLEEITALLNATTYDEYLADNAQVNPGKDDVEVTAKDILPSETTASAVLYTAEELKQVLDEKYNDIQKITDKMRADTPNAVLKIEQHNAFNEKYVEEMLNAAAQGMEGYENVVYLPDTGHATFGFEIEDPGMYSVEIEYMSTEPTSNNIEKGIKIDGEYPYKEARSIAFLGYWVDEYDTRYEDDIRDTFTDYTSELLDKYGFLRDLNGNEVKPVKAARPTWDKRFVHASTGYYNEPLKFNLEAGEHTISVIGGVPWLLRQSESSLKKNFPRMKKFLPTITQRVISLQQILLSRFRRNTHLLLPILQSILLTTVPRL